MRKVFYMLLFHAFVGLAFPDVQKLNLNSRKMWKYIFIISPVLPAMEQKSF